MTPALLLTRLRELGVTLTTDGVRLRCEAPPQVLSEELRQAMAARKPELIALIQATSVEIPRLDPAEEHPPSPAQRTMWFLDQLLPGTALFNIPVAVRVSGPVDLPVLGRTITEILRRHDSLRTNIRARDGRPVAVVRPPAPAAIDVVDLDVTGTPAADAAVRDWLNAEARRPFNLERDPLLRVRVLRVGRDESVIALTVHHIVADGWSVVLLVRECASLYQAFMLGRPSPLPELPVQYADYAAWQNDELREARLETQLAYWKRQLRGAPPLELPTDRPRPPVLGHRGRERTFTIDADLGQALQAFSQREGVTLFMTLLAAFKALVFRYSGQTDVTIGTAISGRSMRGLEGLIGLFVNSLVLRTDLSGDPTFRELLQRVRTTAVDAYAHQDVPFERVIEHVQPARDMSRAPIFQAMFIMQPEPPPTLAGAGQRLTVLPIHNGTAKYDLMLMLSPDPNRLLVVCEWDTDLFDEETIERMIDHYRSLLRSAVDDADARIGDLALLSLAERADLMGRAGTHSAPAGDLARDAIARRTAEHPDRIALICGGEEWTYGELDAVAERIAGRLRAVGVGPEVLVGLCVRRSCALVAAMLGVWKAGGAYVPFDPADPLERTEIIRHDAGLTHLIVDDPGQPVGRRFDGHVLALDGISADEEPPRAVVPLLPSHAAYVLFTSGSTGVPKGVVVEHRNVSNFCQGMDERLGTDPNERWLAVTPITFDIAVLELLWPLTHGATVVIAPGRVPHLLAGARPAAPVTFSLFYFASEEGEGATDKYRLLLDSARFADEHGFEAVWVPERHFHAFGALFPNPSVLGAALATVTKRVRIRAGSVVLPLHHPVRVAEEWSVVDNLSGGRAGISVASGWQPNDFVLATHAYTARREVMRQHIDTVRRLWRGETLDLEGPSGGVAVSIKPRPIQAELPLWITAAGSIETFTLAGQIGANVLTHLLGQTIEELEEKIAAYRLALREHGFPSGHGRVTLMLHTFVGDDDDQVRGVVREPLIRYLRDSVDLMKSVAGVPAGFDLSVIPKSELDRILARAFDRYFDTSGLFGTAERCLSLVARLQRAGVDEMACLIDFGVPVDAVLASLEALARLQAMAQAPPPDSIDTIVARHGVTHLQCTPSTARLLLADADAARSLRHLQTIVVGGEALDAPLARALKDATPAAVLNAYGPTETTVWVSTSRVSGAEDPVPLGDPIVNTRLHIVDERTRLVPFNVAGELIIAGDNVARGYLNRPELTAERFFVDPFERRRAYRSGDRVRRRRDGAIEFLGRLDNQVKLRGHRIELGEIESVIARHPAVAEAAALVVGAGAAAQLVGVVTARDAASPPDDLRKWLRDKLPDPMIPSSIVVVPALPRTSHGKLDRRALEPLVATAAKPERAAIVAPRTETEVKLAEIWRDVLKLPAVGVYDHFFDLGGHSLLATQVMARVRSVLGVEVSLRTLFESPTIAALAEAVDRQRRATLAAVTAPIPRASRDQPVPLTFAQERIWRIESVAPGGVKFNVLFAARVDGPIDLARLDHSLSTIVARHESLRTTFHERDGEPIQVVHPPRPVGVSITDLTGQPADVAEATARQVFGDEARKGFDLERWPLFRVRVVRIGEQAHMFAIIMHHIIHDHWSLGVLIRELQTVYLLGSDDALPELPIQLPDFAIWQRRVFDDERLARAIEEQAARVRRMPPLQLPYDRPRPTAPTNRRGGERFVLPPESMALVYRASRVESVTPFIILLSAFSAVLRAYSGQAHLLVGTAVAGRSRVEVEDLIGVFSNTLPLLIDTRADRTFRDLLASVREAVLDGHARQDVPYEKLVDALDMRREATLVPLCRAVFVLDAPLGDAHSGAMSVTPIVDLPEDERRIFYDLRIELKESQNGLGGLFRYNSDVFDAATVRRLAADFHEVLEVALDDLETPLARLLPRAASVVADDAHPQPGVGV